MSSRRFLGSRFAFSLLTAIGFSVLPVVGFAGGPALPRGAPAGKVESGMASWHEPDPKSRTASQHPWSGTELVAAHKTRPLGSKVRVRNLSNGREVIVTITDRGPYRHGRVIDVSRSAAEQLGLIDKGTAHVRLETVQPDGP